MKDQEISYTGNQQNQQLRSASAAEVVPAYAVKCTNQSSESTYFYFFQRTANQTSVIASLVWCASLYKVPPGGSFTFNWQETYAYFWQGYGAVQPTVIFEAQGTEAASPETSVLFSIEADTPVFSAVTQVDISGMQVNSKFNIPADTFGVGIGMSAVATFLVQAIANGVQEFETTPLYHIASADQIETGMVLSESSKNPQAPVVFPDNVYSMELTYNAGQFYNQGVPLG